MRVGRNDPCPCGSGRKYKRCCLEKDEAAKPAPRPGSEVERVAPGAIGDYGPPDLSEEFFAAHPLEFSAARVLNNTMHAPELAMMVNEFVRERIPRGEDDLRRTEQAVSAVELVEIMKQKPDPLNHEAIIRRALDLADETVPLILWDCFHFFRLRIMKTRVSITKREEHQRLRRPAASRKWACPSAGQWGTL